MKNRIISIILAIMLIVPCFAVFGTVASAATLPSTSDYINMEFASEAEKLEQMKYEQNENGEWVETDKPQLENQYMELYVHPVSGEIGIRNKVTGEIMLSNPYNVKNAGIDLSKQQYLSTLTLTYKNITYGGETTYYSYKDSCVHNQMKIEPILNGAGAKTGIKVIYEFGKKELVLPLALTKEDFDALMARMQTNDDANGTSYAKTAAKYYTYSEKEEIYIIKGTSEKNKQTLQSFFVSIGYTTDEMHADYEEVGFNYLTGYLNKGTYVDYSLGVTFEPSFKVAICYTLTDDGFTASVDAGSIEYDSKNYSLISMSVLPYFNAALHKTENGYTFLPDGSGTLIRYEDLRASGSNDNVTTSLYGPDYAYYTVSVKNQEQATFPVFGSVVTNKDVPCGFFAIIEKGDSLASITSHNDSNFHSVYSSYKVSASDNYDLADSFSSGASSSNVITVNGVSTYTGEIRVRYAMLTPASLSDVEHPSAKYDTSYIGMANYYRDYLQANGALTQLQESELTEYTRIFLEAFGSLQVEEKILTFPVTVSKELTTFQDIMKMHRQLSNIGVDNMTFILTGFANGGLENNYPTYIKWQNVLGGAEGYSELMGYAKESGLEIAPNVNFSYSQGVKTFSGFQYKKTAAKALDGRYTTKREYDASVQMFQRTGGVVISSGSYELAYDKFVKSASKYEITSLATRALGSDLSSDFDDDTGYIFREDSKINTQNMLSSLSEKSSYNLILDAGNAYALKYASGLTNVALDSSRLLNTSEAVPFTGMVLHGSIEFAGGAINMEGDDKYMFLKALENGAGLYYTVAMQNTELLKGTENYNQYYSVQFDIWRDKIAQTYNKYNAVMASKQSSYITEHEFLNSEYGYNVIRAQDLIDNPDKEPVKLNNSRVVRVEYANGEGFILNYNSYDVIVECGEFAEPVTIPALDFVSYGMN